MLCGTLDFPCLSSPMPPTILQPTPNGRTIFWTFHLKSIDEFLPAKLGCTRTDPIGIRACMSHAESVSMGSHSLKLVALLRPYWKLLTVAFLAMLVEGAADLLEPWPLKVIFDYVLGSKHVPSWL